MGVIGERFGMVLIVDIATRRRGVARVVGRCDCGTQKEFFLGNLKRGLTRSCGCRHTTHGQSYSSEYKAWINMIARCYKPTDQSFSKYGGRGITVCERWRDSFDAFFADMGRKPSPGLSIERKDNNGPYSPDNCKWATWREQGNNRRTSRLVTIHGQTKTMTQWSRESGLSHQVIDDRIRRGWPEERWLNAVR